MHDDDSFHGVQGHGEEKQKWAKQLGKLIYAVEHQRALLHEVVRQAARDAELPLGLEELEPPLFGDEPTYAIGCDPLPGQHYAHDLASWAVEGGSAAGAGASEHTEQAAEDSALMHFSPLSGDSQQLELLVPDCNDPVQPQQDQQQQSQQLQVTFRPERPPLSTVWATQLVYIGDSNAWMAMHVLNSSASHRCRISCMYLHNQPLPPGPWHACGPGAAALPT